jgi:hypothetical protein
MAQDLLVHIVIKHFCKKVNKMQKLKTVSTLICLIVVLAAGCGKVVSTQITVGEEILTVDKMNENSQTTCKISVRGDTDIEFMWIVDDQTVGTFFSPEAASTEFITKDVDEDTTVKIMVIVSSAHNDDVIRTKQITVVDIPKPKPESDKNKTIEVPITTPISKPSDNVSPDKRDSSIADIQEESKEILEPDDEEADDITLEPADIGGYTSIIIYNCGCYSGLVSAKNPSILDQTGHVVYGRTYNTGDFTDEMNDILLDEGIIKYCHSLNEAMNHEIAGSNPLIIKATGVTKDSTSPLIRNAVISSADAEKIRNISKDSAIFREFRVIFVKSCEEYTPPVKEFTGIIINTLGLDISICEKPKILYPDETLLYGEWGGSELSVEQRGYLESEGSVKYCYSWKNALDHPRAGDLPLILKADRAIKEDGMNKYVVLSNESADRIKKVYNLQQLLKNFKVVLLIDKDFLLTDEPEDDSEE